MKDGKVVFIDAISTFIPSTFLSIESLCKELGLPHVTALIFSRFHGIKKIPYAQDISYYQMIENAVKPLLQNMDVTQLKYIVHSSVNYAWPFGHTTLALLQENLGLFETEIFRVNIHECTSTITALEILSSLLANEEKDCKAILVASDIEMDPKRGLPHIPITGDASAAIVLSNKPGHHRLVATQITSYPQFAERIWKTEEKARQYEEMFFSMMESNFKQCLEKAGVKLEAIQCILPLNSSIGALGAIAKHLDFPSDRIFTKNISKIAHCFGADAIINLESVLAENILKEGDYYMMFSIGQSGSFGSAIFQY